MQFDDVVHAAAGRQDYIRDSAGVSIVDVALDAGTHKLLLPVGGANGVDVTLTLDSHTGTAPTVQIYATFLDGAQKGDEVDFNSGSALSDDTEYTESISTSDDGQRTRYVTVEITVPASATATFGRAEWAAL